MFKISVKQDIEKDAWNFWEACNKTSHGVDWKSRIDPNVSNAIQTKTFEDAKSFLIPYLENYYLKNKELMNKIVVDVQNIFDLKLDESCRRMELVTKRKLYKNDFICFLTTFPRCPYSLENGYIWFYINLSKEKCIDVFLHELLHFQFIYYFKNKVDLSEKDFDYLKEAMTVILNLEFEDLMFSPDNGYIIYKELRQKLLDFWTKDKDFDKLIEYGVSEIKMLRNV